MLSLISHKEIIKLVSKRNYESKLGENLIVGSINELAKTGVRFVVLGIQESIGPRANLGNAGAENAWSSFLNTFVNIQNNKFIDASKIGILGSFKFYNKETELKSLRENVEIIDRQVEEAIASIVKHKMIPIVIGGGHNNAFPIIKGSSKALGSPLNVINCDPHADFRPLEGRHSGNGFSYAMEVGALDKYFILGLHQSYNGENILDKFKTVNKNEEKIKWSYFDNWIYGKSTIEIDLELGIDFIKGKHVGVELDMDAIGMMPSSAFSPSGIQLNEARMYVSKCAASLNVSYFHLPEAAPKNELENKIVGKALSYLVGDFIKNR